MNYDIEHNAEIAKLTSIPSKLKATIRFGYEDGLKAAFGNNSFDEWTQSVLAHAQVHFRHNVVALILLMMMMTGLIKNEIRLNCIQMREI